MLQFWLFWGSSTLIVIVYFSYIYFVLSSLFGTKGYSSWRIICCDLKWRQGDTAQDTSHQDGSQVRSDSVNTHTDCQDGERGHFLPACFLCSCLFVLSLSGLDSLSLWFRLSLSGSDSLSLSFDNIVFVLIRGECHPHRTKESKMQNYFFWKWAADFQCSQCPSSNVSLVRLMI